MPFSFPASPSVGQQSTQNGRVYQWTGSAWDLAATANNHTHISSNITDLLETIDDEVAGLLVAGSGINLNYNDPANTLTISTSGLQSLLTNPVTGVGISGYLSKWTGSNTVSSGIIYDNGSRIGIGINNPTENLEVAGNIKANNIIHPFLLGGM